MRSSDVRRHRLENGLTILVLEDHEAPIVSYQTWLRVGSRNERPGATGMAHLFEHLMFNRTRTHGPGELDRQIERTGGDVNAVTWVDWTYYRDSVPSRDLELVTRLEADRMQNLVLEPPEVEAEREVVATERLMRVDDDIEGFLDEELFRLAYTEHPYHWPTIGWMEDIRSISLDEVREFYRAYYAPNNAIVVIVGDVTEAGALELVERHYGGIPAAPVPADHARPEPEQLTERRATYRKPTAAPKLLQGYKIPGNADPDWAVLSLVASLLCGGPSARLYRRLVVDRELATQVDCAPMPFRDPALFRVGVSLRAGAAVAEVEAELERALSALANEPVPPDELQKVKNGVETEFWSSLETNDGKAEALGHYEAALGDHRLLFEIADRLALVTAEDVARVARAYLVPGRRTVVVAEGDPDHDAERDA